MRNGRRAIVVAFGALVLTAAFGFAEPSRARGGGRLVVTLRSQNHSGVSGSAVLRQVGSSVRVILSLTKPVPGALPAYIRAGTCAQRPSTNHLRIRHFLNGVVAGKSDTTFPETLANLQKGVFSVNVYEQEFPDRAIACGNIPRT